MKDKNSLLKLILFWILIALMISVKITNSDHKDSTFCSSHTELCDMNSKSPCCIELDKCLKIRWGPHQHEYRCVKEVLLGDSCESSLDCQNVFHATCTSKNNCECQSNFVAVNNSKCMAPLNGFCLNDSDCLTYNSTCKNFQCKCKFDLQPTLTNACEPKKLFKFCRKDEECNNIIHAKCSIDNECVCRPNNIAVNNSVCLPKMNAFCWKNEPCAIMNSLCINNECNCRPGFKNIQNEFCAETYLDKPCKKNIDCADIKNSECYLNKFCDCTENAMKLNETFCAPLLGGYCVHDGQCVPDNSHCVDNVCQCKTNFAAVAQYRCTLVPLEKYCRAHSECRDKEHRECSRDNKCICKTNHISVNKSTCLPVIDGFCITDDDCQPRDSYCSNHHCKCKPGFLALSNEQCILRSSAVDCRSNEDCGDEMRQECSTDNKCVCKYNSISLETYGCKSLIGGYCVNNIDCAIINSVCVYNECQCKFTLPPIARNLCPTSI